MKVFWSWQNDTKKKVNRTFIQSALTESLELVANDLALDPAERPELDHDTKNEPGLVDIVNTIFKKIAEADAFVADVTPIAKTEKGKEVANPNVMIELGHAITALGHEKIITVANTFYGGEPENLPFDLRHRRGAITFHLNPDEVNSKGGAAKQQLIRSLADALKINLRIASEVRDSQVSFNKYPSRDGDRSIWLKDGEQVEVGDFYNENSGILKKKVVGEVRSYVRAVPASWSRGLPTRSEVKKYGNHRGAPLMGSFGNATGGANSLGFASVGIFREDETHTATQWFNDTGEIWAFDSTFGDLYGGSAFIAVPSMLKNWAAMLKQIIEMYDQLGASKPYWIEIGVTGLKGKQWRHPNAYGPLIAHDDEVFVERTSRDWSDADRLNFLTEAFNKVANAFSLDPEPTVVVAKIIGAT